MINLPFSLRDLEYVVAVFDHGHFGRAAEALSVSQPSLSIQIKKTEELFNIEIFSRQNKKISVTPEGEIFVSSARRVLEEARLLASQLTGKDVKTHLTLRLGAIATVGPYLFPQIIPKMKSLGTYQFQFKEGFTPNLIADLRSGKLDAVIASPTFDSSGLTELELYFEKFYLALPANHPLAEKKTIHVRDLETKKMILLEDGNCLREQSIDLCPANRRGYTATYHAASLETVKYLVSIGDGYTILPEFALYLPPALKKAVVIRPLMMNQSAAGRKISFFFNPNTRYQEIVMQLRKLIQGAVQ